MLNFVEDTVESVKNNNNHLLLGVKLSKQCLMCGITKKFAKKLLRHRSRNIGNLLLLLLLELSVVVLCLCNWLVQHCPHRKQFRRIGRFWLDLVLVSNVLLMFY